MNDIFIEAYKLGCEYYIKGLNKEDFKAKSEEELHYFIKGYEDAMKKVVDEENISKGLN